MAGHIIRMPPGRPANHAMYCKRPNPSKFRTGASLITIPAFFINSIVATSHFSMLSRHLSMYRLIEECHVVRLAK